MTWVATLQDAVLEHLRVLAHGLQLDLLLHRQLTVQRLGCVGCRSQV